jgi:hypothetical protein
MWRRRALLCFAASAAIWGLAVIAGGGLALATPFGLLTSRNPSRPAIVAGLLALWYYARWRHHWHEDAGRLARLDWPPIIAASAAAGALALGIGWGSALAAGPDASGYVSQAELWVTGELTRSAPEWSRDAPWADATFTASPVGYRPGWQPHTIVPWYSPGLPLVMALVQRAGVRAAVFYVVPLFGGLTVWLTYLLGRWLAGPWSGAAASVLLLCSPAFLVMHTSAMSDVPVTAWWTLALYAALPMRRVASSPAPSSLAASSAAAVACGLATTLAILTRPNTAPLAGVVFALVLIEPTVRVRRAGIWTALTAVSVAVIAVLNWQWYGSPTQSAYGSLADIYALDRVWPNAVAYAGWLLESQTPLVLLALVAPWVLCRRALLSSPSPSLLPLLLLTVAFPVVVVALYVPYLVFPDWWTLRFLLPAYPPMLAGIAAALVVMVRVHRARTVATATMAVLVVACAYHGLRYRDGPFVVAAADDRYARVLAYTNRLPEPAVFVSLNHSGTIAFYTGRDVLRWEALAPALLDTAVEYLGTKGLRVYLVADDVEQEPFLRFFATSRRAQALRDAIPARLGGVSLYALDGRNDLPTVAARH